MNLKDYADSSFNILYYAANSTIANEFLVTLYKTSLSYNKKETYHVFRTISASEIMTNPNFHSIKVRTKLQLFSII